MKELLRFTLKLKKRFPKRGANIKPFLIPATLLKKYFYKILKSDFLTLETSNSVSLSGCKYNPVF
ncbi:hypothetical protein, partial [Aequorivita sp. KMM 9714]|uniref:hypothetical protein n=1 Tax=Aequorivita sp. KMM 9714 TaxID=2707173 RepID=UPI0019D704AA